jgi:ribosomal protein S9
MSKVQKQRVQTFGRKKTATAVAICQQGLIFFTVSIDF